MYCIIHSACLIGLESIKVKVEISATHGLPQETIIGLPDTVVKESKARIKSALNNIKINLNGNYLITYNSLNIMSYHKIEKTLTEIFKVLK